MNAEWKDGKACLNVRKKTTCTRKANQWLFAQVSLETIINTALNDLSILILELVGLISISVSEQHFKSILEFGITIIEITFASVFLSNVSTHLFMNFFNEYIKNQHSRMMIISIIETGIFSASFFLVLYLISISGIAIFEMNGIPFYILFSFFCSVATNYIDHYLFEKRRKN